MTKEEIVEILERNFKGSHNPHLYFNDAADAILALREIDFPTDEDIDKWADYCASNSVTNKEHLYLIKAALSLGALWIKGETLKRNKK